MTHTRADERRAQIGVVVAALLFGSTFVFLLVWGVGGLLPVFHHHHEKHA